MWSREWALEIHVRPFASLRPEHADGVFVKAERTHPCPRETLRRVLPIVDVSLDRDVFLRTLIRHLAGALPDFVGDERASEIVAQVGTSMGEEIGRSYKAALGTERFSRRDIAEILVDLKRRVRGDFYVAEEHDDKIVLEGRTCPLGAMVIGRPSLCQITVNVFGAIASKHLAGAEVQLEEAIANGAPRCRVAIHLSSTPDEEADACEARERGENEDG